MATAGPAQQAWVPIINAWCCDKHNYNYPNRSGCDNVSLLNIVDFSRLRQKVVQRRQSCAYPTPGSWAAPDTGLWTSWSAFLHLLRCLYPTWPAQLLLLLPLILLLLLRTAAPTAPAAAALALQGHQPVLYLTGQGLRRLLLLLLLLCLCCVLQAGRVRAPAWCQMTG
jgi:hypothetical protein